MNNDKKIEDFLCKHGNDMNITPYEIINRHIIPHNHNVFLTEKACAHHMETNAHHFNKPYSYVDYAFRNPELEQLYEALFEITGEKK